MDYIPPKQPIIQQYLDPRDYRANHVQDLLRRIRLLESSGGIDTNHRTVESGLQKGETAIGDYGLMPNTIEELSNRYPSPIYEKMNKDELIKKVQEDPELARTMAGTMGSFLKDKRGLTDEEAAAAWEQGHNLKPANIKLDTARGRKFKVLDKK